jgi:hypothetical protein
MKEVKIKNTNTNIQRILIIGKYKKEVETHRDEGDLTSLLKYVLGKGNPLP